MSKFSELIRFCAQQFKNQSPCTECGMDMCRSCESETCYPCLKHIHSIYNNTLHYSCEKITYNYILKHGYRYTSEMAWAFYDVKDIFAPEQPLCIFSVGSGPSTELYAATKIFKNNTLYYYGFDLSDKWRIIQDFNHQNLESDKIKITYLGYDFNKYVKDNNLRCDILVMNYLLSDFIKFHPKECEEFLDELINQIIEGRFKLIIINDVMLMYKSGTGFSCMEKIANKVKDSDRFSFKFERRHFTPPNEWQFPYGTMYRNNNIADPILEEAIPFDPFKECGSIQLIIKTYPKN